MSRKHKTPAPVAPADAPPRFDVLAALGRYAMPAFIALLLIATLRIAATYDVFNHTIDEPAHIAAGMEWLDRHAYTYETQHPPLARVASALLPYLDGARTAGRIGIYNEGAAILYGQNHYDRTLRLARFGILPFFWLASAVIFVWCRRTLGPGIALIAVAIFTTMPAILAHSGLATTDMALTALLLAAVFAAARWAESPTWARSVVFGVAGALAILSKFSAIPFFAAAAVIAVAWWYLRERPAPAAILAIARERALPLLCAIAIGTVLVWSAYRFSTAEFFDGIHSVREHNRGGHVSYLLGETSDVGFWYYYPVALVFKTPLGFLLLAAAGFVLFWRNAKPPSALRIAASLGAALLAVGMWSNINIGTRHILPIFGVMAIFGAYAVARAVEARAAWPRYTALALLLWSIAAPATQHPDYLAYFNELAAGEPERILVDSDLDWGQDMKRLSARLREAHATSVTFDPFIVAYLEKAHGFPTILSSHPAAPAYGWNAVSLTVLKLNKLGLDPSEKARPWPENVPVQQRVGKGVLLYYFADRR